MTTTLSDLQQATRTVLVHKIYDLGHSVKPLDEISEGPIVTIYRVQPTGNTKVSHLEAMAQDFAITLCVEDVVVKRLPGESAVGIWVPNKERKYVQFRDTIGSLWKEKDRCHIPLNLGVDHLGRPQIQDLTSLPHLLIAGSTGSGKSTLISAILGGLIYCKSSTDIRLILSDTKGVEFGHFVGAPHLLFEPATTVYSTLERMDWLIEEMERRLKIIARSGERNINDYNAKQEHKIHYIALVIDELADIIGDSSRSGDGGDGRSIGKVAIARLGKLAQKARATGIHIIAATQRPSVKLISGDVKSNFPARLSFRLPSGFDSRTVLSEEGAEHLLSQGDMLFINPNKPGVQRLHAPYARIEDITAAVDVATRREQ
jgi:S-DNA-T family DNA segregation ATPase FtsK/SpoIIIE